MYRKSAKGWTKHGDFILLELIILQVSFVIAFYMKNGIGTFHIWESETYRLIALILLLVDCVVIYFSDTFKDVLRRGILKELAESVKHTLLVMILTIAFIFVTKKGSDVSRMVFLLTGIFHVVFSYLIRILYKNAILTIMKKSGFKSLLVISSSADAEKNIDSIEKNNFGFYQISGIVLSDDDTRIGQEIAGVPVICSFNDVPRYVTRKWVDEVLFIIDINEEKALKIYKKLVEGGVTTHISLNVFEKLDYRPHIVEKVAGQMVLTSCINYSTVRQVFVKRVMDILGGIVGSIITIILMIIVGPLIFFSSPGHIFFLQERIGLNGKKFKIVKFRTMYPDAEERKKALMDQNSNNNDRMFKMDFDPRVIGNKVLPDGTHKTGIGQFLRNHSIDEFPQFFNVLLGQMSLVGTRPPTPDEWEKYDLHHRARLAIKPGVTGLWQVSGRSDIKDFEEVVKLDTEYITNYSLGSDIKIIFKTIWVVLSGSGAK